MYTLIFYCIIFIYKLFIFSFSIVCLNFININLRLMEAFYKKNSPMLKNRLFIILLFFVFWVFCKEKQNHQDHSGHSHPSMVEFKKNFCDVHKGNCSFEIKINENNTLKGNLDLKPKPVYAMKEIEFFLTLENSSLEDPEILLDLTMPAMYMGENQVSLKKISNGVYSGKGVFPECTMDDRLWNIKILIKDKNHQKLDTDIQFNIYQ